MLSKSIEPADYKELQDGLKLLFKGEGTLRGEGVPYYMPHHHRKWEYGSAAQAYLNSYGPTITRTILDVGCGSGLLGPSLFLGTKAIILEIDTDHRLLETRPLLGTFLDEKEAHRLQYRHGSIVDKQPAQFDAVFCISVIEHVPEDLQDQAWANLASLVLPGGILVVTTDFGPDHTTPWYADTERHYKFDPARVQERADFLTSQGFHIDIDPTFYGVEVHDYTFFRWVAKKNMVLG